MSSFIDRIISQAKDVETTIVLPEGDDNRTIDAARIILEQGIAHLVILRSSTLPPIEDTALSDACFIDPAESQNRESYAQAFYELRKHKGMTEEQAFETVGDPLYFANMMVKMGDADGVVCGACHATSDVLRPALQILKTAPGVKAVSTFFVMVVPDCTMGSNGVFIFSDCGLEVQPDAEKLAHIAINSARSWTSFFDSEPKVALLSHSSHGSAAQNDDRDKVIEAVRIAHELDASIALDGELQLDAAIVEEVAASKAPDSPVAGKANVLIFPDLDAGNIGYKLVQRLAHAEAYGPITQGLAAPVNDLSRGCTASDIVGVVALTALQAQQTKANG